MLRFAFVVIFFVGITVVAPAQTVASIELKVQNLEEGIFTVTVPVNHTVFWGASRIDTLKAKKAHVISLNESQTGFVQMEVLGRIIRLFVQKGDHLKVNINEEDETQPLKIDGNNSAGQFTLSNNDLLYVGNLISRYKSDTTAALLSKHVEADKKLRSDVFKILFDQKKIDQAFYSFVTLTLDYYHATLLSEIIYSKFNLTQLPKEHPQYTGFFPPDFGALWEQVYKQYPVNNVAALQSFGYSDGFNTYAGNYLNGYVSWLKTRYGTGNNFKPDWSAEIKETFQRMQNNLNVQVAEFVEAGMLFAELSLEKNYDELLKLTDAFRKKYTNSAYWNYLQPLVNTAQAYQKKVSTDFTSEQLFVPDYARVNSFAELMQHFKGKPVYIEFWATWCYTCKDQFNYQKDLNKFLQSKGIAHVFVSVDHQNSINEWKELIKFHDLKGSHIRANPSLVKSLSAIFWDGKGYALPLYAIMGASGKILNDDALKPADRKRLYQQIESLVQ